MYIAQMMPFLYNISQILNNMSQYLLALYVVKLLLVSTCKALGPRMCKHVKT